MARSILWSFERKLQIKPGQRVAVVNAPSGSVVPVQRPYGRRGPLETGAGNPVNTMRLGACAGPVGRHKI